AMQFADHAFPLFPAPLCRGTMPSFTAVCVVLTRQRCQRPLALLSVGYHSGRDRRGQTNQEGNHHRPAGRTVAEITAAAAVQQVTEIHDCLEGSIHEIAEASVTRADKSPTMPAS